MAVVLLGEPFTAWLAAGTVLVVAGMLLLARQSHANAAL
jgi:drug/metabolite transporter (DMT)-like permease